MAGPGKPKLGIALGSGSARGWAHLGVLRALGEAGVKPDIVCGCSIGAFIGAAYANGDLERLEEWVSGLTWQSVVSLLDVSLKSGLIKGNKLIQFFEQQFVNVPFESLPVPFGCVATELDSGREVWLREGNVAQAVRASIALPGLFTPVRRQGTLLVDGGLVNPVPVSLCRAMGADIVIAVDLGSDLVGRAFRGNGVQPPVTNIEADMRWTSRLLARLGLAGNGNDPSLPSLLTVINASINIMQVRIARSRLAGEPAEMLIAPRLAQLGLMDYHRGREAIAEGQAAVQRVLPALQDVLQLA